MIYLLRHGVVTGNGEKRFIGQSDPLLSEAGRHQARQWHRIFGIVEFEAILCSDLKRSEETARIIAGDKKKVIRIMPELREIHLGQWEGLSMAYVRRHFSEKWRKRGENLSNYRPSGGESFKDLQNRVVPVFEAVTGKLKGHGLIVAHAGVNRVILCHVLGMPLSNLFRLAQDYGALNIIDCGKNSAQVLALNLQPVDLQSRENKVDL
ncbi:MAG: histidine phosphatase family protein [Planctomycetota bacterium]|jgi:probable phosphoglycerate mutase